MKTLLEAGVHFGHQTRRWDPRMRPFIFTERNGIHIIDLQQTVRRLDEAMDFVRQQAADGKTMLFVGTKKQAQDTIAEEAARARYAVRQPALDGRHADQLRDHPDPPAADGRPRAAQGERRVRPLPKKEAIRLQDELEKLQRMLGGCARRIACPTWSSSSIRIAKASRSPRPTA